MKFSGMCSEDSTISWTGLLPYQRTTYSRYGICSPWRTVKSSARFHSASANYFAVVCPPPSTTSLPRLSTGSFWRLYVFPYAFFDDGATVARSRSTETLFLIPSSCIVILVGDSLITMDRPVLWDISLLYDSVSRRSGSKVVIGGWLR